MAERLSYLPLNKRHKKKLIEFIQKVAYKDNPIKKFNNSYQKWLYEDSPAGKAITYLALDKDKLAGHYSVVPIFLKFKNRKIKAAVSVDSVTSPDYRRRGIFTILAERVYNQAKKEKVSFVFGFPNENSFDGFIKKLNWAYIGNIPQLILPIQPKKVLKVKLKSALISNLLSIPLSAYVRIRLFKKRQLMNLSEIKEFDNTINSFWKKVRTNKISIYRDKDFLNWRFFSGPIKYRVFAAKTGKEIKGYAVLREANLEGLHMGIIVDILSLNEEVTKDLINHSISFFTKKKVELITTIMQKNTPYYPILKKFGFIKIPDFIHPRKWKLGALKRDEFSAEISELKNWFITFSDFDVV
jgi:GNAT superfamily N-acetyltransferase